jgi:hypothetical protein
MIGSVITNLDKLFKSVIMNWQIVLRGLRGLRAFTLGWMALF